MKSNSDNNQQSSERLIYQKGTFGYDHDFISRYTDVIVLSGKDTNARVLVSPAYQGRVITSSFDASDGISLGYVNHKRIASTKVEPHIQAYGGEDRFWIGPQGGQYTIYFNPGDPFDFEHWFTPKPIDQEPFEVINVSESAVALKKEMQVRNYSGFTFNLEVNRTINLIDRQQAKKYLGLSDLNDVKYVGFESDNKLKNIGKESWKKETGLLSIWILGQFPAGAAIVIPYKNEPDADTEKVYNEYFGGLVPQLTAQQIKTGPKAVYYKGSGNEIGKIGLPYKTAAPFIGSYNSKTNVLTIIQYSLPGQEADYVNSQWEVQKKPYSGDVINAYNDGPLDTGAQVTPTFYELESSSPAYELKPGEQVSHYHRTFHFQGTEAELNKISKVLLGATIETIGQQF